MVYKSWRHLDRYFTISYSNAIKLIVATFFIVIVGLIYTTNQDIFIDSGIPWILMPIYAILLGVLVIKPFIHLVMGYYYKHKIKSLINTASPKYGVIVGIKRKRYSKDEDSYIIRYRYIVKLDADIYISQDVKHNDFKIGGQVPIYKNLNSSFFYIDLGEYKFYPNAIENKKIVQDYFHDKYHITIPEAREKIKNINIIFIAVSVIALISFIYVSFEYPLMWIFVIILLYGYYSLFIIFTNNKRLSNYKLNSIYDVGVITDIKKSGQKIFPLGYVPNSEYISSYFGTTTLDMKKYNNYYGYTFRLILKVNGKKLKSQNFIDPFPDNIGVGDKIKVYYKNSKKKKYLVDIQSVIDLKKYK